jgi:hypothetical protein
MGSYKCWLFRCCHSYNCISLANEYQYLIVVDWVDCYLHEYRAQTPDMIAADVKACEEVVEEVSSAAQQASFC